MAFSSGLTFLTCLGLSCDGVQVDGGCHDAGTGEELKEVRDADGELFPVTKVSFDLGNLIIDYCGVSIDAQVVESDLGVEVLCAIARRVASVPVPYSFSRLRHLFQQT